jgi:hypothetical protein
VNEVATYLSFGLQTEHRPALTECEKGFESPTSRCKMKHRIDWDYVRYFLAVARGGLRFDENRGAAGQFSRSPLDVGRNEELAHEGSRALPHPFDRHLSRGPRRLMQPSVQLVSLVPAHQVSSPGLRT